MTRAPAGGAAGRNGTADITFFGTGEFAARALFDLAISADRPLTVQVVGRNAPRLAWLRTAANARAALFGRPLRVVTEVCSDFDDDAVGRVLAVARPRVVFQAASLQTASVIRAADTGWSQLVQQGGLSATAPFQMVLSLRIARAVQRVTPGTAFINACFPDVVNPMLAAAGVPLLCGVGNVGILGSAFAGSASAGSAAADSRRDADGARLRILAHYQQLAAWRKPPAERSGSAPRVWLDEQEVGDVFAAFPGVMLSPQAAFDISGATGVPLLLALATGRPWHGHVPGPLGLPGGYPVRLDADGRIALDLPAGLSPEEATRWNEAFELRSGLTVGTDGRARYHGRLRELLELHEPRLAQGFACGDVEQVAPLLAALRDRLQAMPATA